MSILDYFPFLQAFAKENKTDVAVKCWWRENKEVWGYLVLLSFCIVQIGPQNSLCVKID